MFGVRCSYADAGVSDEYKSNTIDVVADVRSEKVCSALEQYL